MGMTQQLTIVSTCTNQKRGAVPQNLHLGNFAGCFHRDSAKAWIDGLESDNPSTPAGELYVGSHWQESLACESAATKQGFEADLWVLSAGYGLISKDEPVTPYAASFAAGGDSIQNLTWPSNFSSKQKAQEWWSLLHRYRKRQDLRRFSKLAKTKQPLLIILSREYYSAVEPEVIDLISAGVNLMIVSAGLAQHLKSASPVVRPHILPFSDSFKQVDDYLNKTNVSLNARLATWLVRNHSKAILNGVDAVKPILEGILQDLPPMVRKDVNRMTDEEVLSFIAANYSDALNSATKMLRRLRDVEQMSCEQKRLVASSANTNNRSKATFLTMSKSIEVRALKVDQAGKIPLYSFYLRGEEILDVAEISRIERNKKGSLLGYQRGEVSRHIGEITAYLDSGDVIFPNAILLAMSSEVKFKQSRGPKIGTHDTQAGVLDIPIGKDGSKVAWIVDGQQRTIALSKARRKNLLVPVTAFVSDDFEVHRGQFLLVNKVKPLPKGLINELLPAVNTTLPASLAKNKIPSALCDLLNRDPESPFQGLLIRETTDRKTNKSAVIADNSLLLVLKNSLEQPPWLSLSISQRGNRRDRHRIGAQDRQPFLVRGEEHFPQRLGSPPKEEPPHGRSRDQVDGGPHGSDHGQPPPRRHQSPTASPHLLESDQTILRMDVRFMGHPRWRSLEYPPEYQPGRPQTLQRLSEDLRSGGSRMKFFFAENCDSVDPDFDFIRDQPNTGRNRSLDLFAHEVLEEAPYDGLLVSRALIEGTTSSKRYSQAQKYRVLREGLRSHFRYPHENYKGDPFDYPIMGDCGSFSYIDERVPPYSAEDTFEFYRATGVQFGVSPDHIILEHNPLWDKPRLRPSHIEERLDFTMRSAAEFLKLAAHSKGTFEPIAPDPMLEQRLSCQTCPRSRETRVSLSRLGRTDFTKHR